MKKIIFLFNILGFFLLIQPISAQTWTASKRLTWNSGNSTLPAISVDSNSHIYVLWTDNTSGNDEIYFKKSTNGGTSWTTKRLTWNSGSSSIPRIAADANNHLHLVWEDDTPGNFELFYKKSTDGGTSWTTKRLTYSSDDSRVPTIVADSNNNLLVAWHDYTPGNDEIYFKKSTNGGTSWTTKRLTYDAGSSVAASIDTDTNNQIHMVWQDDRAGNYEIFYGRSTNGGTSWTTKRLTYNLGGSAAPSIAVDANNHIHIVWFDDSIGNSEIYYKKSTNGGTSWTTKRLTYTASFSLIPSIATDAKNRIHVAWFDWTPGNYEIYYKRSTNGGTSWTTKRLTYNLGGSAVPSMAIDSSNNIYMVWHDNTPANIEIFFRKGTQ